MLNEINCLFPSQIFHPTPFSWIKKHQTYQTVILLWCSSQKIVTDSFFSSPRCTTIHQSNSPFTVHAAWVAYRVWLLETCSALIAQGQCEVNYLWIWDIIQNNTQKYNKQELSLWIQSTDQPGRMEGEETERTNKTEKHDIMYIIQLAWTEVKVSVWWQSSHVF